MAQSNIVCDADCSVDVHRSKWECNINKARGDEMKEYTMTQAAEVVKAIMAYGVIVQV